MKKILTVCLLAISFMAGAENIATEKVIVKSPYPEGIFCFTPALCEGLNGRLVALVDFGGPETGRLDGPRSNGGDYDSGNQIRVMLSDDNGLTWRHTDTRLPMMHENIFRDGKRLYIIGHCGPLVITYSDDNGETWSGLSILNDETKWHQSSVAIDIYKGKITLVYESYTDYAHWPGVGLHLMQARCGSDLTRVDSWNFSPMYDTNKGPLETNTLRIYDRRHPLYDPSGKSWVLLSRCGDGSVGKAIITRGLELPDGSLAIEEFSDRYAIDFPGGNMKFDIVFDKKSRLYWLVHAVNIPGESDRRTLGLSYSPDLFNWKFAGTVARGATDNESRHYASLIIKGADLLIVSRSGDKDAVCAHDTDIITFHKVSGFRKLAK